MAIYKRELLALLNEPVEGRRPYCDSRQLARLSQLSSSHVINAVHTNTPYPREPIVLHSPLSEREQVSRDTIIALEMTKEIDESRTARIFPGRTKNDIQSIVQDKDKNESPSFLVSEPIYSCTLPHPKKHSTALRHPPSCSDRVHNHQLDGGVVYDPQFSVQYHPVFVYSESSGPITSFAVDKVCSIYG